MDAISGMEFDFVASGHYAKIVHTSTEQLDEPSVLKLSKDMWCCFTSRTKPTSFLISHRLSLNDLFSHLDVSKRMKFACLPSHLIYQTKTGRIHTEYVFLARHIGESEGVILEAESGDYLGNHRGFWFYTIGQRQGLRLLGGPWYVVEKDISNNVVYVSRNYFSVDKKRRLFRVGSLKWLSGLRPRQISELQCKPLVAVKNKIQQKICSKGHFLGLKRDESLGKNQGGLHTQQTDVPYAYQPQCNISHWV